MPLLRLPTLLRAPVTRRAFTSSVTQWRAALPAQEKLQQSADEGAKEGIVLSKIERLMALADNLARNGGGHGQGVESLRGMPSPAGKVSRVQLDSSIGKGRLTQVLTLLMDYRRRHLYLEQSFSRYLPPGECR